MRVFIAVDMEGATGVVHPDQLTPDGRNYTKAQRLLTADINAVIQGILDVHPNAEILIGDGHATMRNVLLEELHPSASLVMGPATTDNKPLCQLEGIQFGADAAMCVGYHSKAGTRGGLLAHTFIGSLIADLRMNGKSVGEVEVNAAVLSSFGIPLAMISGNSDLESEIRQWNTSSVFVSTKTTLGPTAAICYSPQTTAAMLRKGASESISNLQNWHLHSLGEVSFEVDTKHPEQLCRAIEHPGVTHVAANTFAVEGPSASEAFRHLWSACLAALGELPQWLR